MTATEAHPTDRPPSPVSGPPPPGRLEAVVTGVLAAGGALAAGELAASLAAPTPGPVVAVANRVVDDAPTWFVDFGKDVFGLNDKPALILGTILISLTLGGLFGLAARRRPWLGVAGFAAFGLIGLLAIGVDAQGGWGAGVVISALAVAAGAAILLFLPSTLAPDRAESGLRPTTAANRAVTAPATDGPGGEPATGEPPSDTPTATAVTASPTDPPVSRRSFLGWAGVVGAAGAVAAAGAREIRARSSASQARDAIEFAATAEEATTELERTVARAATGQVGSTEGITPLVVPSDEFYLIDTALIKPQVDPADWSLTIRGMVDNELTITYDELLERATTIAPVTLSCVSNEVGGDLVGNAIWRGVPLTDLLDEAGVHPRASQIASRSVDGWTCGFPTEAAYDGRTALVAVGMNDEPLPIRHGFPARLVVSGLYGYVSATKWLSEIELTTLEAFDGYWIPRGWSKLGPIKTQSRIDTPRRGTEVAAGTVVAIAGVAWAPDRGVDTVEVQVDDGEWVAASLGETLGADAWVQWLLPWEATPGRHVIRVRATDGTGETQTSEPAPPAPDGAQGWHAIEIDAV
jgi:DMSO/TMAO reductase YedYZ molybdopterin-dependent catalytic subunit